MNRVCAAICSGLLTVVFVSTPLAQTAAPPPVNPTDLVRRAIQHRFDADTRHQPERYLLHVQDERHNTTKDIIETKDGDVARLISAEGKPLSPIRNQAELARLDNLAANPDLQRHHHSSERKDAERIDRLMALLPDAMLYHLEGIEPCNAGRCYHLSFTPNPNWTPPDLESKIFRGIAGDAWIDVAQERLTRLEGHFITDVTFGFGILGKVYKGGSIGLEQTNVLVKDWELTSLKVNVTGKAFMIKSMNVRIEEDASHFTLAPAGLDYRQAIQLLKTSHPLESTTAANR